MMMMDGCSDGGMILWSLLLLGLVVGGIWLAVRAFRSDSSTGSTPSTARQLLDERYARGELDDEEYDRRRRTLG